MRAVIQRCSRCSVISEGIKTGEIGKGFLVFLGIQKGDTEKDADYLADKIVHLRILSDEEGKLNLSVLDKKEALFVVSQFTLCGDVRHGRRPSFTDAEIPGKAEPLYEYFVGKCRGFGLPVETGRFQTDMQVSLVNDGPVTILIDSRKNF